MIKVSIVKKNKLTMKKRFFRGNRDKYETKLISKARVLGSIEIFFSHLNREQYLDVGIPV